MTTPAPFNVEAVVDAQRLSGFNIGLFVLGFLVMVPSATYALATWRGRAATSGSAQPSPAQQVEQAMGLDDPPHRFGVVEGGRSARRDVSGAIRRPDRRVGYGPRERERGGGRPGPPGRS